MDTLQQRQARVVEQLKEARRALTDLAQTQFGQRTEDDVLRSLQAAKLVDQLLEVIEQEKPIPYDAMILKHLDGESD